MKKSDIAAIVLIAGFATIVAFVLANIFLGDPSEDKVIVQYMGVIASDVAQPSDELFNDLAINPTVETYVGQCGNDETWDDAEGRCVNNNIPDTPSQTEDEDEDEDADTDAEGGDTNEPTLPGE